jgi:hypothetical protein
MGVASCREWAGLPYLAPDPARQTVVSVLGPNTAKQYSRQYYEMRAVRRCTRNQVGNNTDADWLIVVAYRPDLCG